MIETWFINDSENADYGTYTCSRCGREFHYSPRDADGETCLCIRCAGG